jgi:hypothetical protein
VPRLRSDKWLAQKSLQGAIVARCKLERRLQ